MPLVPAAERDAAAARPGAADDVVLDCLPLLLAQASHDLNNHLATILGKSEIALMSEDPGRWRNGLDETLRAGHQARLLVADLQRLVTWQQLGSDGPVPLSDVLAMIVRLSGRSLRRCGAEVAVDGGATILVERPATLAVLGWLLVREAADRAEAGVGRGWRLGGRRAHAGWALEFHAEDHPFRSEEWGARGAPAGVFARIDRALRALDGRLELDGPLTRFAFR